MSVKKETSASSQSAGALLKFRRRPGKVGLHGELYGVKMAEFLFARALNKTEEFRLASNVDGAGAFDDLVFRYRLRDTNVWKTCFIQVKHKENGGTIQRSSLTQMSGNYSLLKYFKSYCEIKSKAATEPNLKQFGPFGDFEFVIYTNEKMTSTSHLQGGNSDPLSILSSGTDYGKYITFDKTSDKDIFGFFEELSRNHKHFRKLDSLLKSRASVDKQINETIKSVNSLVTNDTIVGKLKGLETKVNTDIDTTWINDIAKCDFTLFEEFLNKVKIFQGQSNEEALNGLIEKELQQACKASPSVASSIYTKFEEGFSKWWKINGKVVWLNEKSGQWQAVQKHIISEIKEISKPAIQEIDECDIRFNQQHAQKLSDAIEQNTVLNIVTNSNIRILQNFKTYQALNSLGYENSLFIDIKSLKNKRKEIKKWWPCKWSDVLVVDCGSDGNAAHTVLDILQQSADCRQGLQTSDDNTVETFVNVLQKYQQKVILISSRQKTSGFKEKLRNVSYFEDNCDITDLDEKSQKLILERPVNFQGTKAKLSTLVGTNLESIKYFLDSEVISILLSKEHELSVGRQLDDHPKYYVPRVLQDQIYLKEDILKLTDYPITFAVSGLQADELKKHLPAGEKIYEFVHDKRDSSYTFKIFSDFSETGLRYECGTTKAYQNVGQKMISNDVKYNIFANKNTDIDFGEESEVNTFRSAAQYPMPGPGFELENMKYYNEWGQNTKPEGVRYVILGNENQESKFRELKLLCRNIHWIHVKEGSFLWRDTNGNIDIIRKYIDKTKCVKYDMKSVVEHKDRTMLLVAEPGMGKSTFLSYMAHEIKKEKPSVCVLKINLNDYTKQLEDFEFEQNCIDKCKEFLWSAAHSPKQDALEVTKEIFLQALEETGRMVIMLDGYDEISPDYSGKVEMLMRTIKDKTVAKIWISSRFTYRQELEDIVGKFAFTLQPFTTENQTQFLEQYWSAFTEISNQGNLQICAKKLLNLCSQTFNDEDGEFTGIPLQTMMLGEAFVNEVKEYCCSGEFNLPEKFNLLSLFKKFTDKKFDIYFKEKNNMDTSKAEVKSNKKDYVEKHMISALLYLFSPDEFKELFGKRNANILEETKRFLREGKAQKFGIITDIKDEKPHFIHRCFALYCAAEWFADNFRECKEFFSNNLFYSTNDLKRNIFVRMLVENSEIHGCVLDNDIHANKEILKEKTDINNLDKEGRTALHLAASYNRPYIQQLLSFPGIDPNKPDGVFKWTPLRYADRTKSWMTMDISLQNGANTDDTVFTGHNIKPRNGDSQVIRNMRPMDINFLEFMLNCGSQVNEIVDVPENLHVKCTLPHRASYCDQVKVVRLTVNRGTEINIRDATNNTVVHLASASDSVNIIKLLLGKGMSVNLANTDEFKLLHLSVQFCHLEATKNLSTEVRL